MTGIRRDRGDIAPVAVTSVSGADYLLLADGSMRPKNFTFRRVEYAGQVTVSMVARTMAEARKKLLELQAKYPKMNLDDALKRTSITTEYLSEPLMVTLPAGGPLVGRSVIATAIAFAVENGIAAHACEIALADLRAEGKPPSCYGFSYLEDIVHERAANPILHCVAIFGDPTTNRLYAYVEYFSYSRWLIELSSQYVGPAINRSYAIDPATASEIEINLCWNRVLKDSARILAGHGAETDRLEQLLAPVFDELMRRSWTRSYNKAYAAAVDSGLKSLGVSCENPLTAAGLKILTQHVFEHMKPFILHCQSWRPKQLSENLTNEISDE